MRGSESSRARENKQEVSVRIPLVYFGLPDRIRTCDLKSRSLARYPAVPRADTIFTTLLLYQKMLDKSIGIHKNFLYRRIFLEKPIAFWISLCYNMKAVYPRCRCDGIGRRAGLKIQSWQQGAGSTPATGTIKKARLLCDLASFYLYRQNGVKPEFRPPAFLRDHFVISFFCFK